MNETNPDRLSVEKYLGLSHHYSQMLSIPVKITSNMLHRNKRKAF